MTKYDNDPDVIRDLLLTPATWAVVGLGDNPGRAAYGVSRWLQHELGDRVVPVHPTAENVHGERAYPTLSAIPDGTEVAVVDCFVNSARVGAIVDEAIAQQGRLGVRAIWMQLGVVDEAAAARARAAGIAVVMDTCPKIEYPRLQPGDGSDVVVG
ncbi:MAG: CoA-binding protein [Lapillicoccus sp.]